MEIKSNHPSYFHSEKWQLLSEISIWFIAKVLMLTMVRRTECVADVKGGPWNPFTHDTHDTLEPYRHELCITPTDTSHFAMISVPETAPALKQSLPVDEVDNVTE